LQGASGAGHIQVVRLLIGNGAKFDAALQIASLAGHDDIISYLLSKGADPNAQGKSFGTALQIATAAGQEKVVQILLSEGAHANDEGKHFGTALEVASAVGNKKLVRLLLEQGADPSLSGGRFWIRTAQLLRGTNPGSGLEYNPNILPLESASAAGHDEIVQMLLEQLPKYTKTWDRWRIGNMFKTSLEKAASNGHLKVVRLLLDNRLKYAVIGDDNPLLQRASAEGHEDIVRFLLGKGVLVNESGSYGTGPLHVATKGNYESIVQLLLEYGADVNYNGPYGTALHIASHGGFENLVRMFFDKKADVDKRGPWESTPLILASAAGHTSVVQLLLHHGADPRVVMKGYSSQYDTASKLGAALQAAIFGGHEKVVRLLLDHPAFSEIKDPKKSIVEEGNVGGNPGGNDSDSDHDVFYSPPQSPELDDFGGDDDPDDYDNAGDIGKSAKEGAGLAINISTGTFGTALQAACHKGDESIVELLLSKGADTNIQGGQYGTPLQAGCLGGFERIVQSLLDNGADINIEKGLYGTALQAAASSGHENIVKLLIDAGADVKSQGGKPEKAYYPYLGADSESDDDGKGYGMGGFDRFNQNESREQRSGVRAHTTRTAVQRRHQCGKYGTALQAAAYVGNANIGMFLPVLIKYCLSFLLISWVLMPKVTLVNSYFTNHFFSDPLVFNRSRNIYDC